MSRNLTTGRFEGVIDSAFCTAVTVAFNNGVKPKQIATQLGVSLGPVYKVLSAAKLVMRKPSGPLEPEMERLYKSGLSQTAVAKCLGLEQATVWRFIKTLGISRSRGCGVKKGISHGRKSVAKDGLKLCTICGGWKNPDEFPYGSTSLDGKRPLCKECQNIKHNVRRSRARHAMPDWVDKIALDAIYAEARQRTKVEGVRYEVDHIEPLNGRSVSGLHVPWNLRVITEEENRAKRNRQTEGIIHGR